MQAKRTKKRIPVDSISTSSSSGIIVIPQGNQRPINLLINRHVVRRVSNIATKRFGSMAKNKFVLQEFRDRITRKEYRLIDDFV